MLNAFFEFIPVLLFFIAFKYYGIYTATIVGIAATGVQFALNLLVTRKVDKKLLITFAIFVLFGGMTLYFHNPIFVKWKPTIIFWIFATVFLASQWIGQQNLVQRLFSSAMEDKQTLPSHVWRKLNFFWSLFFYGLGGLNLFIAYNFSDDAWVNFKLYGITGILIFVSFAQAIYLMRYVVEQR